ncbi:MAG: hypothetical protein AB9907_11280 [Flexilinea sp.]
MSADLPILMNLEQIRIPFLTDLKPYPDGTDESLKADGMKTFGVITGAIFGLYPYIFTLLLKNRSISND